MRMSVGGTGASLVSAFLVLLIKSFQAFACRRDACIAYRLTQSSVKLPTPEASHADETGINPARCGQPAGVQSRKAMTVTYSRIARLTARRPSFRFRPPPLLLLKEPLQPTLNLLPPEPHFPLPGLHLLPRGPRLHPALPRHPPSLHRHRARR